MSLLQKRVCDRHPDGHNEIAEAQEFYEMKFADGNSVDLCVPCWNDFHTFMDSMKTPALPAAPVTPATPMPTPPVATAMPVGTNPPIDNGVPTA